MSISSAWDLSSDAELITAVRSGETAAFGVLYERHAAAARAVARQYSNSAPDADDAVSDAFSRVFSAVQGGGGPDVAFRAYLFTVVRRVALSRVESGRRAVATDDIETFESATGPGESTEEPTMAGFERGIVSQAYKSLPERWQAVLWYTEVEELNPAQIAPILGLTANGVAALAYRAREGLRQAYLQQHLAVPSSEACTIVNRKLGAYVRGGLAKRETALVESHLEECGSCRALILELGDVNHGMRVVIAPLILGAVAIGILKGVGFGGLAGAVGAGLGAGAGSGAAFGSGMGAGSGAAAGSGLGAGATGAGVGAGVGSGAAVSSGVAASGLVVAGAGAAAISTPSAAASSSGGLGAGAGAGATGSTTSGAATGSTTNGAATGSTTTGAATGSTTGVTAGAGAVTGGSGISSLVGAGGLSTFVAGLPVGVLGISAAAVVVAGVVAVAGAMGSFSPAPPEAGPSAVVDGDDETGTDETGTDGTGTDGTGTDGADAGTGSLTPDATAPGSADGPTGDGTDPTNIPDDPDASGTPTDSEPIAGDRVPSPTAGGARPADPGTPPVTPGTPPVTSGTPPVTPGTPPVTPGTPPVTPPVTPPLDPGTPPVDPGTPPVDPGTPPVAPPVVRAAPPAGIVLTSGSPGIAQIAVSNTGGSLAGQVLTELVFPSGLDWEVTALGALPDAAGAARSGFAAVVPSSAWSCAPTSDVAATCTLADLPNGATSTLIVSILVDAPDLDGEQTISVGLVTWSPDGGAVRPEPVVVLTTVTSRPARLEPGAVVGLGDVLVAGAPRAVTVPVVNTGGTTATGVVATVGLPDDVTAAVAAPWSCTTTATGDLDCSLATLARHGGDQPLRLTLMAGAGLRNVVRPGQVLSVTVGAPGLDPVTVTSAPVTVRSAPARYVLAAAPVDVIRPGRAQELHVELSNTGGTDGSALLVRAAVPAGMTAVPGGSGWLGCAGSTTDVCLTVPGASSDAAIDLPPLTLAALGSGPLGARDVVLTVTDSQGVTATTTVNVTVGAVQPPLAVTGMPADLTAGVAGPVSFSIMNTSTATISDLVADVFVATPTQWVEGAPTGRWTCSDAPRGGAPGAEGVCELGDDLPPGATTTLTVLVLSPVHTENGAPQIVRVAVRADGAEPVWGVAPVTVTRR